MVLKILKDLIKTKYYKKHLNCYLNILNNKIKINIMKVTIIVGGKFHAFNLAEQINNKKSLNQIVTSYPKYKLKKYGINKRQISSII